MTRLLKKPKSMSRESGRLMGMADLAFARIIKVVRGVEAHSACTSEIAQNYPWL